ncbi:lipopolysaccharide kinase InaA family protein [Sulfuriflexus mobilis]|uniref:lipopolysaccharide kinase InaA family protein n=1 Tax=Sulfuriflexus mobilis TaxID=1811807 RepID=UPI000F84AEAE|nr:lipopolysaccharide kinase InaA family protein [Sulfuriflexus mobilis]
MQDYQADNWKAFLANNGLKSFDDWWQREADWFEEPNYRRGGWSGVSRLELRATDGSTRVVFLKRQENHVAKTLLHPLRGVPTFVREMHNILRLKEAGVAALEPVYFAVRTINGAQRAVLVTESLDGFTPLDEISTGELEHSARRQLIKAVATLVRRLHAKNLQHNCLYPKHIFVKQTGAGFEARLIDLEKTKRRLFERTAMVRDLDSLNRHTHNWSSADRLFFLHSYLHSESLTSAVRNLWSQLLERRKKRYKAREDKNH